MDCFDRGIGSGFRILRRLCGSSPCGGLTTMGDLAGMAGPWSGCLPGPPCVEGAGHWLLCLSHRVAGCLTPGEPQGLCWPSDGQSQVLRSNCRIRGCQSWNCTSVVWNWILGQLAKGPSVSQSWCWPEGRQDRAQLVDGLSLQAPRLQFSLGVSACWWVMLVPR